jgi:Nuclease-related domain/UvrD-like helicase C-terminal domain/AAA domain
MAKMIPSEPFAGTPISERRVFDALRCLNDEWTVLHSVNWQSKRAGRQGDGEADFVLISNRDGVVVLEVKGGNIAIKKGCWVTTDHAGVEHIIKDPFRQATDSKHALLAYLGSNGIRLSDISLMHAVAFPDVAVASSLGPAAPGPITWDSRALASIDQTIRTTIHHWGGRSSLSIKQTQHMIGLIAPTVSIRRRLAEDIADVRTKLIELTGEQIWIFSQLRSVRNALVTGGAGTGKTILAIERARRLASDGFRTLLVCYKELLSRFISMQFENDLGVHATTFRGLCASEAAKASLHIPRERVEEWWEATAPVLLIEAAAKNETSFDAIVVDEGQDFSEDWIGALRLLSSGSNDAPMYVFADRHQRLYRRHWEAPGDWTRLELNLNCRSTIPIAERVASLFGEPLQARGTAGPAPQFYVIDVQNEGTRFVQNFSARLIDDEGIRPDQICLLSNDAPLLSRLRELLAGSSAFVRFGERGIVTETIARYKGLEADVVIVVVTDDLLKDTHASELLYTGISRAKAALFVVGSEAVRRLACWK